MTTQFYAPPSCFEGERVRLQDDEARHLTRSLRKEAGDEIVVVDGQGGWYRVVLEQIGRGEALGFVREQRREVGELSVDLTIGLGLLKNRNRFETFLEKATEFGVRRIVPLLSERTEKTGFRADRAERICVAAMKQCGRSRLPEIAEPTDFESAIQTAQGGVLCHESAPAASTLSGTLAAAETESVSVWVGPEGGFSDEEVTLARGAGVRIATLGNRRLRAETAGIAVAALASSIYSIEQTDE